MSIQLKNSGTYFDINDPSGYWAQYVDINDPNAYSESVQGAPQDEVLADPVPEQSQNELLTRRRLMGLVAKHYTDRHVHKKLVLEVKSSDLQAGLLHRVQTIGDNALELRRHIEGLGRDELSAQFVEVVDRIQRLPQAYQQAPLAILLTRCQQEKVLSNPKELCTLATLVASRPSEEKVEKLVQALHVFVCAHGVPARTALVWHCLSGAMGVGNKSEPTNGSEYAATFLRVLAIVIREFQSGYGSIEGNPPDNFDCLLVMRALKDMKGRPNDKLRVLSFLLTVSRKLSDKEYEVVFKLLKTLPLKEHVPERELVFKAIFRRVDECKATLRSGVVNAYIRLISPFNSKDRERSLHLMFVTESAWACKELTDKFFDALRQFDLPFEDMIEQGIFRVSDTTRARLLLKAFVRYIRRQPIETQEVMLTDLLRRVEKALQSGKNFKVDGHCVNALKNGLAALKP